MKILHILTDRNIGGAGRHLCYLLEAADREQNEYRVLLPAGATLTPRLRALGVPVTEVEGMNASRCPRAYRALLAAIREARPDVVHTHSCYTAQKAAKRAGVPCRVLTKHCSDLPPRRQRLFPARLWARLTYYRGLSAAIATDDSAAEALRAAGCPAEKIHIIYNGCPAPREVSPEETEALRQKYGIPAGVFTVGWFGRMEPVKNPVCLLQAAALALRVTPDLHFLFCGDGSLRRELEETAARYGIRGNVTFAGFVEDTAPYLSLCHVIANTSVGTETSSLSLCEAMARGAVPFVSDIGGNANLIGQSGIVTEPDNPAALCNLFLEFARDPGQTAAYSARARKRYAERCTAARMAKETEELYDSFSG